MRICGSKFLEKAAKLHVNQRWRFGDDARMDDAGVLKGVRNPGNIKMWINPLGPGQYPTVDGMEQAAKAGGSNIMQHNHYVNVKPCLSTS